MKIYISLIAVLASLTGAPVHVGAQTLYVPSGTGGIGNSTVSDKVGIGTSAPDEHLTLNASAGTNRLVSFKASGTTIGYLGVGGDNVMRIMTTDSAKIALATNWTDRLTVSGGGNVGINTSIPDELLSLNGSTGANRLVSFRASDNTKAYVGLGTDNTLRVQTLDTASVALSTNGGDRLTINGDGYVGIGTATPASRLTVVQNANTSSGAQLEVSPTGGGSSTTSLVSKLRFRATFGSYAADQAPRVTAQLQAGYAGGAWGSEYLAFQVGGSDDYGNSPTEWVRISADGKVGIGTTTPTHKLSVNGTIQAKEVIVDTGWSDYVFADNYRLAPLSEVEAHIKAKGHLPGIPSAADVEAGGVSLGEMQSKLLAKVEELTLHLIRMEKENAELRQQVSVLKTRP